MGRPRADLHGPDAGGGGAGVRRRVGRLVRCDRLADRADHQLPGRRRRQGGLPAAGHGHRGGARARGARRAGARRLPADGQVVLRQRHRPQRLGDLGGVRLRGQQALRQPRRQQPARVAAVPGPPRAGRADRQLAHHRTVRHRQLRLHGHRRLRAGEPHVHLLRAARPAQPALDARRLHADALRGGARGVEGRAGPRTGDRRHPGRPDDRHRLVRQLPGAGRARRVRGRLQRHPQRRLRRDDPAVGGAGGRRRADPRGARRLAAVLAARLPQRPLHRAAALRPAADLVDQPVLAHGPLAARHHDHVPEPPGAGHRPGVGRRVSARRDPQVPDQPRHHHMRRTGPGAE
ncbi:hypothetical protein SCOCK_160010 [Actinacidiphila cocklensis]|uniref:Uncharacterized protein n=1 Tax=Actinacidiphila cocklensis TaxID=887465 RepID=A0A9W4DQL2_9ACTN|nr:hypothetical protein SCOCK_160010 [Actinacidiphila cocklensis]